MKIAHVIDSAGLYGAEQVLLDLMEEQTRMGMAPSLVSMAVPSAPKKALEDEALRRRLTVVRAEVPEGIAALAADGLARAVEAGGPDLVHSHGYKSDILLGFRRRCSRRYALAATVHGWTGHRLLSRMKLYEWLDRASLRRMDGVVFVDAGQVERFGTKGYCLVMAIPNGIRSTGDADRSNGLDPEIVLFCRGGFTFVSLGRLSPEKCYPVLITAIRMLVDQGIEARLLILGEGPQRHELEQLVQRLDLGACVLMPGFRPSGRSYAALARVFVLASSSEGMPISILEAMTAGIPVVATAVGGVPGLLRGGEAGVLVPPGDADALARALAELSREPERAQGLAETARKLAAEEHSVSAMSQRYLDFYEEVLQRFGRRASQAVVAGG